MKHGHILITTIGLTLGFACSGCSHQEAPADASQGKMEEAPVAADDPPAPMPAPEPFPPTIGWDDPDPSCTEEERPVLVRRGNESYHACVSTVLQSELGASTAEAILIEAPVLTRYDRKLSCKAMHCRNPGIALLQPDGSLVPLTKDGVFVGCSGLPRSNVPDPYQCPSEGAARILGTVTRHEFPGRPTPDFTFELLAAEPASAAGSQPTPPSSETAETPPGSGLK